MGRLRSTIRAYALEGRPPEEVLDLADRKLQHFEPNEMATAVCAVLCDPFDTMLIASAGHLPPVLADATGETRLLDTGKSAPLGVPLDVGREATTVPLTPGDLLFLYTDGLIERRYEPLDVGLDRLRTTIRPGGANSVCRTVTETLIGASDPEDDVAVIAVRSIPSDS